QFWWLNPDGILQFCLREIVFAQEVQMLPRHHGAVLDGLEKGRALFSIRGVGELLRDIQIIPSHDAIVDKSFPTSDDLLLVLFGLQKLAGIAYRHRAGKAMGQLNLIELPFNRLAQRDVVNVAQDEERLEDLAKRL